MKLVQLSLLAAFLAAPLLAQHDDHVTTAAAAAPPSAATGQASEAAATDPHAGHTMPAAEAEVDPHAGHTMPAAEAASAADPMAGHDMGSMSAGAVPPLPESPPPPEAFSGPEHAADALFDPQVMTAARAHLRDEHGDFRTYWLMVDQLETLIRDGENAYLWDAQGWSGGDINKLWVKTEGEGRKGESAEQLEVQLLWSHAIAPWWDIQAGVRHDFSPSPERSHLVVGLQGLVPYQFEVDAAAFVSDDGDLSARIETEYDQWLTQRLLLQPRLEVNLAAQDVPELGIGSGVSSAELGLRLRYQIAREFAPYIGVEYERRFGHTADFARVAGEDTGGWNFVIGVQMWF